MNAANNHVSMEEESELQVRMQSGWHFDSSLVRPSVENLVVPQEKTNMLSKQNIIFWMKQQALL